MPWPAINKNSHFLSLSPQCALHGRKEHEQIDEWRGVQVGITESVDPTTQLRRLRQVPVFTSDRYETLRHTNVNVGALSRHQQPRNITDEFIMRLKMSHNAVGVSVILVCWHCSYCSCTESDANYAWRAVNGRYQELLLTASPISASVSNRFSFPYIRLVRSSRHNWTLGLYLRVV